VKFDFSQEKNELLFKNRGVTFYEVIESIAENGILLNFDHPNKEKYPNQKVFVVNIDNYAYCVPYVVDDDTWFLKTIYPSRKFKYLIEGGEDE
jgi:uncharacterized DUF497 family protein